MCGRCGCIRRLLFGGICMKQQQALVLTDQLISLVSDNSEKQKLLLSLQSIKEILEKQVASSQGVKLYRIENNSTMGWQQVENYKGLSKSVCSERLNALINEGWNPNDLRVARDV